MDPATQREISQRSRARTLARRATGALVVVAAVGGLLWSAGNGSDPVDQASAQGTAPSTTAAPSESSTSIDVSPQHAEIPDDIEALLSAPDADDRPWEEAGQPALPADPEQPPSAEAGTPELDPDGLFGWGAGQPPAMTNLVEYGRSTLPMSSDRRALLGQQLDFVRRKAMEIGTVAEAERRGYHLNYHRIDGRGYEYVNFRYMTDEIDLAHPFMLVFEGDQPTSRIIAVNFNVLGTLEDGPPKYFPLEMVPWHWHYSLCSVGGSIVGSNIPERCEELNATVHPELDHWMVDLWIIPGWENPWGIQSSKHPDMYEVPQPWYADPNNQIGDPSDDPELNHGHG